MRRHYAIRRATNAYTLVSQLQTVKNIRSFNWILLAVHTPPCEDTP